MRACCFLKGKIDSFLFVTTVISASGFPEASLKPLTRAHRTIQHFSKNTHPQHKTKIPQTAAVSPTEAKRPRMAYLGFVLVRSSPYRINDTENTSPSTTVSQPPNRTVLFNIASILCLSMLFSKNSEAVTPKAFEKNTSSTPHNTVPVSPGFSMITHLISTRVSSGGAI